MAPAKKKKAPTKAAAGKTEASQQADEEENVETVDTRATSVMQLAEDHCIKIDQDGRKETLHLLPLHLCRNWLPLCVNCRTKVTTSLIIPKHLKRRPRSKRVSVMTRSKALL